ncbi:uncharacterized protein PAC_13427 [Phialocephala subalpina]|uniref:Cupin 2 conserved barrel domain-containing protein n=1 Tax=Phialocephala subalpina TaxID=576137 RepID=A0A1L7XEQ8_9HELO|nr:uncharacterized protein PAC_13427 [Phialocephala subalpina]
MASQFQPAVVHITRNALDGSSSFIPSAPAPTQLMSPTSQLSYIYSTPPSFSIASNSDLEHHNAILSSNIAPSAGTPGNPETPMPLFPASGGSVCAILDFAPNVEGGGGFMHRTKTVDYIVVLEGEMELELYGGEGKGEKRIVKKGEVVVQRECMHCWRNASKTDGARMLCVAVGGEGAVEGKMEFLGQ